MEIVDDETLIDIDEAVEILARALRANPRARWRAIAKVRQLFNVLQSQLESPRVYRLPEAKPIAPRFKSFYAVVAELFEVA